MKTKTCTDCKQNLTLNFFGKNRSSKDGYQNICKECKRRRNQKTNPKHRDKYKKQNLNKPLKRIEFMEEINTKPGYQNIHEQYIQSRNYTLPAIVESPMGTGKSQVVIDVINQNLGKTIVYLTVNISTLENIHQEFEDRGIEFISHLDQQFDLKTYQGVNVITITPDSYHKIPEPDILIVDEVQSVFVEMTSKTEEQLNENFNDELQRKITFIDTYKRIINHPNYVLLDAEVPEWLFTFEAKTKIKNIYKKSKDIRIYRQDENRYLQDKFIKLITKKSKTEVTISVHSDSKRFLSKVKEVLITEGIPENDICLYTADNRVSLDVLNETRIKLISPVISRGVSIKSETVFVFDTGLVLHPYVIFQMVDRARESKVIHIGLSTNKKPKKQKYVIQTILGNHILSKYQQLETTNEENRIDYIINLLQKNYSYHYFTSKDEILDGIIKNCIYSNQIPNTRKLKSMGYKEADIKKYFSLNLINIRPDLYLKLVS
jgi:hypothetical protein